VWVLWQDHDASLSFDLAELAALSVHMDEGAMQAPKNRSISFLDF